MRDCIAPERPASPFSYDLEVAVEGLELDRPTVVRPDPVESGRWWALEQGGTLVTFTEEVEPTVVLDVADRIVEHPNFEIGALGFAFHPTYPARPWVYVTFTGHPETAGMVATLQLSAFPVGEGRRLDVDGERVLLQIDLPSEFHHGGTLEFDGAGMLLLSLGDGGVRENAGDPTTLLGSLLRIDVDGPPPYGIPADNPFVDDVVVRPEIYAYGFRNLWKFSVDRATGALFGGDVGGGRSEEIDRIEVGADHGWPTWEGTVCRIEPCDTASVPPIVEYGHDEGLAVIGGYVYRGATLPELVGKLVYGDWRDAKVWAVDPTLPGAAPELLLEAGESMSTFAEGPDGELYVVTRLGGDNLKRLVPNPGAGADDLPAALSDTGCVDEADATRPAEHLLPYEVNLPLWSDGLAKDRWLSLPPDDVVRVADDGDWDLPVGTVLGKTFRAGGRLVETRLFMRHPDGDWGGYTYRWNEAQTEAWLQTGSRLVTIDDIVWTVPTRSDCFECHTAAAGRTLGLETAQLHRGVTDPATGAWLSQLDLWSDLGAFDDPGAPGLARVDRLRRPNERGASLESRARDYLHVNCSPCHRPGNAGVPGMDLRRTTPLADTGVCDEEPQVEDETFEGMRLLAPGLPQRSILLRRMTRTGARRMPPLGTAVPDLDAISVVRFWIQGLTGCE